MPLFGLPLALWALAAVPVLTAIYWLRNRFRRHPVSSLILWMNQRRAREGGSRVQRLQIPLLFLLELLAIILLVAAAARPLIQSSRTTRPLVVVLDDSFSMRAGGTDSPRSKAIAAVENELRRGLHYSVRFVLAGQAPQVLGEPVKTVAEADALLDRWTCRSPSAALDAALTFAAELGGSRARILVVSDQAPSAPLSGDRTRWWAFGSPRPNVAFVNAARTSLEGRERCLFEIANLSPEPARTTLSISGAETSGQPSRTVLDLKPHETRRIVLEFGEQTATLQARLGDDALRTDNTLVLLPRPLRPVRVQVRVADEVLRPLVEKAVAATGQAQLVAARAELVITDDAALRAAGAETWVAQLLVEKEAEAYAGPFVMDRTHPLTEGLSLEGVVWGGGKTTELPGVPVISAGNTPLLADAGGLTGRHHVRIRLRPDLSTLQDTPNWPILIWNLVQWRAAEAPGLRQTNLRLGMEALLKVPAGAASVRAVCPDGSTRELPVHGALVAVEADDVGTYRIVAGNSEYAFASNALDRAESDLTPCASVTLGDWAYTASLRHESRSIAWVFLLLAMAALSTHAALAGRRA